jgi:hypothetical protein
VRYRLELKKNPLAHRICIGSEHFGLDRKDCFNAAHNFVGNVFRATPVLKAGDQLSAFVGIKAVRLGQKVIRFDVEHWSEEAIKFQICRNDDGYHHLDSRASQNVLAALFEFLVGRTGTEEFLAVLSSESSGTRPLPRGFMFGQHSTGTVVVYSPPDGLRREQVRCSFDGDKLRLPDAIESLVDRANQVLRSDAPGIWAVPDQPMLAPRHVAVTMIDPDVGDSQLQIGLSNSSYRYYAAFAFAELLAQYQPSVFAPLLAFARDVPDPTQPSPASCSMGVRVLLETTDAQFIVAHRSRNVKLNPDVWSVSANEGVRGSLLHVPGVDPQALLHLAAEKAVRNELRVSAEEHDEPLLLSIYRNHYNQWGAGFWMRTALSAAEVLARQPKSIHHWEHTTVQPVPVDIEGCGRAMGQLGVRWYGGALETICTVLSWRFMKSKKYLPPQDVATVLNRAAGGLIVPADEANNALLPIK